MYQYSLRRGQISPAESGWSPGWPISRDGLPRGHGPGGQNRGERGALRGPGRQTAASLPGRRRHDDDERNRLRIPNHQLPLGLKPPFLLILFNIYILGEIFRPLNLN